MNRLLITLCRVAAGAAFALVGCKMDPAPSGQAASATVAPTATALPSRPILPPDPTPSQAALASQVPDFEKKIAADAKYAALWAGGAKRDELNSFLTVVSELLIEGAAPVEATKPLHARGQFDAAKNLFLIFVRAGTLPEDFTKHARAHLAATRAEAHLGVWAPYANGTAVHDYSALAAWLMREDPAYLRERLAAKRQGPTKWKTHASPSPIPYLAEELAALDWLALLAPLTPEESARGAVLRADAKVLKVDISKLLAEYRDNEVRADTQFKGKDVKLVGVVREIKKDVTGSIYVTLGAGAEADAHDLHCLVDDEQAKTVAALSRGTSVTVRGRVTGLVLASVVVTGCLFGE